jgi:toxin ParE1/3/4
MNLVLSPAALSDLQSISDYTLQTWGEEQETAYLDQLWEALEKISLRPEACKSRDELLPGCRSERCGKHVIFFRADGDAIGVIRILHAAMDFPNHLPSGLI